MGLTRAPAASLRSARPCIVLADSDWTGTVAAMRCLGSHGIPVIVVDSEALTCGRFSRYATRALRSPRADSAEYIDWLCDLGRREPGHVLYPTSDTVTFLYAVHADRLRRWYRLPLTDLEGIIGVLDKKRLYASADAAGIETPETLFPESAADVARVAREHAGPLLIKNRTQVLSKTLSKGVTVADSRELPAAYRHFEERSAYGAELMQHCAEAAKPMIQRYHRDASDDIYILAGYIDRSGRLLGARASKKILQWPRRLGIGLCFERADVDERLLARVRELCAAAGYWGVFQIEFIESDRRRLLIDFNPRFYHPLAFDIARGLDLPFIAYADACGDETTLARFANRPVDETHPSEWTAFCNGFGFRVMLAAQGLSGQMPHQQRREWRGWYRSHAGHRIDSIADRHDPLPLVVYVGRQLYAYGRHPRAFVRTIVLNR